MIRVLAPAAPDAGRMAAVTSLPDGRAVRNAAAFDRLWERLARTYFSGPEALGRDDHLGTHAILSTDAQRILAEEGVDNAVVVTGLRGALNAEPPTVPLWAPGCAAATPSCAPPC